MVDHNKNNKPNYMREKTVRVIERDINKKTYLKDQPEEKEQEIRIIKSQFFFVVL
jgi:hypothetical protein